MSATIQLQQSTALVWKSSGGDYAITLTSLANAAMRESVKGDLGATFARIWNLFFTTSVASAATNGLTVDVYWCTSTNATAGTSNPGSLTGTDATVSNPSEVKLQLTFVGSLALSNAQGTGIQRQEFNLFPKSRYGFPVIVNSSGQSLGSTAGDHTITLTPIQDISA